MSRFIDHPTISFQISSETRLARRYKQGLSIYIKNQRFHIFTFPFSFIILYPIKANMQVTGFFA